VFDVEGWKPVNLRTPVIEKLDKLKKELGVRGRSEVIEKLIEFYGEKEGQKNNVVEEVVVKNEFLKYTIEKDGEEYLVVEYSSDYYDGKRGRIVKITKSLERAKEIMWRLVQDEVKV